LTAPPAGVSDIPGPIPLRLVVASLILAGVAVAGRRGIKAAAIETARATRREAQEAGLVHILALLAIVAIGIALRLHFYFGPMRWDESYTFIAYVSKPLEPAISLYDYPNNHVFHTLLAHVSCVTLSDLSTCSPGAIRAPVFAAGVLVPVAAYAGGLRLYGRHVALFTAAATASAAQLVEYSTNARGYAIVALAAAAQVALAPQLLRSSNAAWWGAFSLVAALGFYTVPVYAYPFTIVVAALAGAILLGQVADRWRRMLVLLGAVGATMAFTALLYGSTVDDVLAGGSVAHQHDYAADERAVGEAVWRMWTLGLPDVVQYVLIAGLAASVLRTVLQWRSDVPLSLSFVAVIAAAGVTHHVVEYTRVWLPLLPIFLVCAISGVLGWSRVRRVLRNRKVDGAVSIVAVAATVALAVVVADRRLADKEPAYLPAAQSIASTLLPRLTAEDHVLVSLNGWYMEAYAFVRAELPAQLLAVEVTPEVAARGRTYLVVNTLLGEKLSTALATMAKGTGLRPVRRLARFDGADLYLLGHRPAAGAKRR